MNFFNLVNQRFSHRGYKTTPVENEKLDYILQCARLAPSASNKQPWKVYVVKDELLKKNIVESYNREWFAEAPVILVFTGLRGKNWTRSDGADYLLCDVTIIADYVILAATEQGLGTVYIAAFDEAKVARALNLPEDEIPLLMTPLGYPREGCTRERKRKEISDWVEYR